MGGVTLDRKRKTASNVTGKKEEGGKEKKKIEVIIGEIER